MVQNVGGIVAQVEAAPLADPEHPSGGRVYGKDGRPFFVVLGPYDKKPATIGNGSMHGFRFDTRGEVEAFHAQALALGGTEL